MERQKARSQQRNDLGIALVGRPCVHFIGKFFLCYIVLFLLETSPPAWSGYYWYIIWNAWLDDDDDDDDDDHYSYVLSTRIGSLVYDDFDDCPQFCPRWWAMVMSDDFHKYGNPKNIIKAPYRCSTVLYIHNVAYILAKLDLVKAAWSTNNRKVIFKGFHWTGSI